MKAEQDRRVETMREKVFGLDRDDWYWCLHCERVYRADEFRFEVFDGERLQMCPYKDCDGSTVLDAIPWSEIVGRNNGYPSVPQRGVVYPLYSSRADLVRLGLK
jgi:hypothetical protein